MTCKLQVRHLNNRLADAEKDIALLFVENHSLEERLMSMENRFSVQSADVDNTKTAETTEEVVSFVDNGMGEHVGELATIDEVAKDIYTGDAELASFLSRPVKIATYTIPLGESFNIRELEPWYLFLNNTAIKKKLDYYGYLQGNLHVKAVINSTPFVYGEYAMSYRPIHTFASQCDVITPTDMVEMTGLTQRPTIYLESHKNKGGEMILPFLWYKNWLELNLADTQRMGQLSIYPLAPFESANGLALTPPTVTLYAWMTEAKLAANTGQLAVQSSDSYGKGPVSGVASAVAGISQRLEDIPVIGKFAKATTIGARAIGGIASLFGFTNVPVIEDVKPLKNTPFHGFSSAEISTPMDKLTLDPKNELSVDTRVCGDSGEDDLAITNFAKREAWIAVADWAQTDAVDTWLISANVSPSHCRTQGSPPSRRFLDTPMGLAARLFSNWRGDIVYRIKIVKSQYHQGRLLFTFDPTGTALLTSSPETVVYSEIVDVSTTDEVVVRIPYMAPQSFLRVDPSASRGLAWKGASITAYDPDYHNGIFRITVLNPLTGPDTTSSVKINVFVHAENFELANPSDVAFPSSLFAVQSADTDDSSINVTLGVSTPSPSQLYSVNFGEDVRSLRTVMRRQSLVNTFADYHTFAYAGDDIAATNFEVFYGLYPAACGYDPNGRVTVSQIVGASTAPANCTPDVPSTWVTSCFVGVRGSYNYAVDPLVNTQCEVTVQRRNEPHGILSGKWSALMSYVLRVYRGYTGQAGMSVTHTETQKSLQFVMPFMNKFRFIDTNPANRNYGSAVDDSENNNFVVSALYPIAASATTPKITAHAHRLYGGIGVDYTPVFFLQVPWRWEYETPYST